MVDVGQEYNRGGKKKKTKTLIPPWQIHPPLRLNSNNY